MKSFFSTHAAILSNSSRFVESDFFHKIAEKSDLLQNVVDLSFLYYQ